MQDPVWLHIRRQLRLSVALSLILCASLAGMPAAQAVDSVRAAQYYEDALARFKRNDVEGSIIQLKNALQQDNKLLAAHVLLGKALLRNGNPPAAEAAFNEALHQGVSRSEVLAPLGRVYLLLGQPKMVIERLQAEDLQLAAKVEVLSIRGIAYADMGDYPMASREFESARTLDPQSIVPLLAEIPVLLSQNQKERAKALADRAVVLAPNSADAWNMSASVAHASLDLPTALERYSKALQIDPGHIDARVARASILLDRNRDDDADKDLKELHRLVPHEARVSYLRAVLAGRHGKSDEVNEALREIVNVVDALPRDWLATREQFLMLGGVAHHGLGGRVKAKAYLDAVVRLNVRNYGARKLLASINLDERDYGAVERALEPVLRDVPNDPQALYLMGQLRLAQKRYVQASQLLDRAALLGGDTAEVRAAIGFTQLGLGQGDAGLKSLEAAFARRPGDPKVGLALAVQYLGRGQGPKAMAAVDAVAKADPGNLAVLNALGAVHAAAGDRAGARKAYQQVLAKNALFAPTVLNLAKLDVAEGHPDDARKRLNTLLGQTKEDDNAMYELGVIEMSARRFTDAQRWFEKAFNQRPTNERAGIALVDLLIAQNATQPALKTARDLLDANSGSIDSLAAMARAQLAAGDRTNLLLTLRDMTKQAEYDPIIQVRIGRLQLMANNPDGAAYNAQKSLTALPGNMAALSLAADAELTRKDFGKAEAFAKELMTRFPNSSEGYRIAGDAAAARGNALAAADAYKGALDRDASTLNMQRLVHALALGGQYAKAISLLQDWLVKHPQDLAGRIGLGEQYMHVADWKRAREQYEKVLQVQPNVPQVLNNLAVVLQNLGDPGAIAMAERAWKQSPTNYNAIDTYGWVLARNGKLDDALRLLRDARLRQPESPDVRYHLAWVLNRLGRKQEAREELTEALKGSARFEEQDDAKRLMKELGA